MAHGLQSTASAGITSVTIGDKTYSVVRIGTQYWMANNLDYAWPGLTFNPGLSYSDAAAYYYQGDSRPRTIAGFSEGMLYNAKAVEALSQLNTLPSGWRVPTVSDCSTLLTYAGNYIPNYRPYNTLTLGAGWVGSYSNGTNDTGFNWVHNGNRRYSYGWGWEDGSNQGYIGQMGDNGARAMCFFSNNIPQIYNNDELSDFCVIRLVHDT